VDSRAAVSRANPAGKTSGPCSSRISTEIREFAVSAVRLRRPALPLVAKDIRELLQHLRSRIVCSGQAEQLPPLKVGNRFPHSTLTDPLLAGVSLDQLARGASDRITRGTRRTFLGQSKNLLEIFE
jgi:hypothetical protein